MYIYQMVFQEWDEIPAEALKDADLLVETDYGTTEILADQYEEFMQLSEDENLKKEIKKGLGIEIHDAFMNGKLDLVLVV